MGRESPPLLRPPAPAVARANAAEAARLLAELARRRVRELVPDPAGEDDARGQAGEGERECGGGRRALEAPAVSGVERASGLEPGEEECGGEDGGAPGEQDEREDPAVVGADGARLTVVGDPGQRERDAEDG